MNAEIRQLMVDRFNEAHEDYPQFGPNYLDGWRLAVTTKELRFKGGNIPGGSLTLARVVTPPMAPAHVDILRFRPDGGVHVCQAESVDAVMALYDETQIPVTGATR